MSVAATRTFNGREYTLLWGGKKTDLVDMAKDERKRGNKTRIVRSPNRRGYLLYTRH